MLTGEDLPGWAKTVVTLALGAGGARLLAVALENHRLSKREFRETLLERIRELEKVVSSLQERIGDLRAELADVKAENAQLKEDMQGSVDRPPSGAGDGRAPSQP